MTTAKYKKVSYSQLSTTLRWDTPRQNQGQQETVSYGFEIRPENCEYFELVENSDSE